ncbi:rhodopsin kinase-like [Lingula anatina]|uniref:Rhodopsin kinase-like n=1 Tax=Lingula anatina TaxID=7574 RepID=A0A1S3HDJ6_LINAN|nr:rhodopsin kinase-like [Lingula anatina]|eukprot:XP_013383586.1 rhodopsin kinase-like [Lingula anatina]
MKNIYNYIFHRETFELEYEVRGLFQQEDTLLPILGRGGFGTVYKLRNNLAMKVPKCMEYGYHIREEVIVMKLAHSDFVLGLVHSFDVRPELTVLISEICPMDLEALKEYCERNFDAVPLRMVQFIATCVCKAIDHLHQLHMAHCDIKDNNVLISQQGIPKLCDLGSAHPLTEDGESIWGPGLVNFTLLKNLTPEVLTGTSASWRVDFYALGVMLFELLEGRILHLNVYSDTLCGLKFPASVKPLGKILHGTIIYTDTDYVFRDLIDSLVCWLFDYYVNDFPDDLVTSPILSIAQEVMTNDEMVLTPLNEHSSVHSETSESDSDLAEILAFYNEASDG